MKRSPKISQSAVSAENPYESRACLLHGYMPRLDISKTAKYLANLDQDQAALLKQGNFSSIAFDVVFSPGIIPKTSQPEYRHAYQNYFQELYGLELFDPQTKEFLYPNEADFYHDPKLGPNDSQFFAEWIANLRAIALMKQSLSIEANVLASFANNVIEAALCRMAENGEQWPDNLLHTVPFRMQERLDRLRVQIAKQLKSGRVLAPGQFFRIANELEFHQEEFMRGNISSRVSVILETLDESSNDERFSVLPPAPTPNTLDFEAGIDWHRPSDRQARQINLHHFLPNDDSARHFTNIMLGLSEKGSIPPLHQD